MGPLQFHRQEMGQSQKFKTIWKITIRLKKTVIWTLDLNRKKTGIQKNKKWPCKTEAVLSFNRENNLIWTKQIAQSCTSYWYKQSRVNQTITVVKKKKLSTPKQAKSFFPIDVVPKGFNFLSFWGNSGHVSGGKFLFLTTV